jgi:asparagine synthase (glutamine-hydrolysing)
MANSLEARAPLLDQKLIAFVARLPFDTKLRGDTAKFLFRQAAARLLPPESLAKRKQGFAIPLASWFRGELRPMLMDTLRSRSFLDRGLFSPQGVQTLIDEHISGRQDRGELLWMLVNFELWARRFGSSMASATEPQTVASIS